MFATAFLLFHVKYENSYRRLVMGHRFYTQNGMRYHDEMVYKKEVSIQVKKSNKEKP